MAINLEPTVAITQNFVSRISLPHVLTFLKSGSQELVSGCAHEERQGLYARFLSALEIHRPSIVKELNYLKEMKDKKQQEEHKLANIFKTGSSDQDEMKGALSSFSFGFMISK